MRCLLDFGIFQNGGDQLFLVAQDFGLLHFDFLLFFHLANLDGFGRNLLLHDVRLNVVRLVGLRLLPFDDFDILRFLDLQVALCFGLRGKRQRFGEHSFLIGLRPGDSGGARGFGTPDSGIAFRFGGGNIGIALDAGDIRAAHIGDVFVLVANFLDGERDYFEAHLAHVVRTGGAHAVTHHLGLFYDLLDRQLADDAAQMTFHHQTNQTFARLVCLGQELLGGSLDRFRVASSL